MTPTIAEQLRAARRRGDVHWNDDGVQDRRLMVGGLVARVRYAPTFAMRQLCYAPETAHGRCALCCSTQSVRDIVRLPAVPLLESFNELFETRHNNFPYLALQIVLVSRDHVHHLKAYHYHALLTFLAWSGYVTAAVQVEGSGASVPRHAHVNVGAEALPIFDLSTHAVRVRTDGVVLATSRSYPESLYRLTGGTADARCRAVTGIADRLTQEGLAYNVYANAGDFYVIPRLREFASALRRKVGSMEAAGFHIADAMDSNGFDLTTLDRAMRQRWLRINGQQFSQALQETVCSKSRGVIVEEAFAR